MKRFDWADFTTTCFCLAPMEGATDAAFRQVVTDVGKPDVLFTEFVNVEGMMSAGKSVVEQSLLFDSREQPLIAQIWGIEPDNFYAAAKEIVKRGFAGVDINMGCPDKAVIKKGTGGALVKNPELAVAIIQAVKKGVKGKIPVSVKIRIGFNQIVTESWAQHILSQEIAALTVHGRTVKELSKVPNHWDEIEKVVKLRNEMGLHTKIIGNGDVESLEEGELLASKYGLDGIMIGRGVFKNPWVFNRTEADREKTKTEKIQLLLKHMDLYERLYGGFYLGDWGYDRTSTKIEWQLSDGSKQLFDGYQVKPFEPMKRFFKIYIQEFKGAAELRNQLMETKTIAQAKEILIGEMS